MSDTEALETLSWQFFNFTSEIINKRAEIFSTKIKE